MTPAPPAPAPPAPPWVAMINPTPLPTVQPLLAGSICATATSCSRCTALTECGWCALEQKCVDGTKLGPKTQQCLAYDFMTCTNIACEARNTCSDCLADHSCGWCAGKARCAKGDGKGPVTSSSCPAPNGFADSRPVWAHAFAATKCQDTPPIHAPALWDSLRGIMYKSQTRIARMQAQAAFVPPPPLAPCQTSPPKPVSMGPTNPPVPYFVATSWFMPQAPTTSTAAITTPKATTTAATTVKPTPCPTMPPPSPRPPPPPPAPKAPPIKINVNVDQVVRNKAEAGSTSGNKEGDKHEAPSMLGAAPAAAGAGSPGMVVAYSPAPAAFSGPPQLMGPPPQAPPGQMPPPVSLGEVPKVEAPKVDLGEVPKVEAPEIEVATPSLG